VCTFGKMDIFWKIRRPCRFGNKVFDEYGVCALTTFSNTICLRQLPAKQQGLFFTE
jgi:hypothetical protein